MSRELARERLRTESDAELIAALRRREPLAFEEFIRRLQPGLLSQARRARVSPAERRQWTLEVLHDVAVHLMSSAVQVRKPLAAYVTTALHRKVIAEFKRRARQNRRDSATSLESGAANEWYVGASASDDSVRRTHGPGWEGPSLSPALERLAAALDEGLSPEERLLLTWASEHVPQREIAEWIGSTRAAVAQRLLRLCRRLRDVARAFGEGELDPIERRELTRFFRRVHALSNHDEASDSG